MTVVCPICNSSAQELSRTRDATGFHCPTHVVSNPNGQKLAHVYFEEELSASLPNKTG